MHFYKNVFYKLKKRELFPSLTTHGQHFDTVVVGGGITGISTALDLRDRGVSVAVLEAREIGCCGTGRATSKVSLLQKLRYNTINSLGKQAVKDYIDLNQFGLNKIRENIEKYNIDCKYRTKDNYTFTWDDSYVQKIKDEYAILKEHIDDVQLITDYDDLQSIGLPKEVAKDLKAAVCVKNQGQMNSYAYVVELAKQIHSSNTPIFENSRVLSVSKTSPHTVKTENGSLTANNVVIATQTPILDFSAHFSYLEPVSCYTATFRLKDDAELPTDMYISADKPARSISTVYDEDGPCLIISGQNNTVLEKDPGDQIIALEKWARQHFPIKEKITDWYGLDFNSPDGIPFIGKMSRTTSTIFTATGFQRWGLSVGVGSGRMIANMITKNNETKQWEDTFDARRWDIVHSAKELSKFNMHVGKHLIGDAVKDMIKIVKPFDIENLAIDDSCITYKGRHPVGVYKDKDGKTHCVSAVCTHLGCHLRFNNMAKTWDCPCHGSRFEIDGAVVQGPAVDALEKHDI